MSTADATVTIPDPEPLTLRDLAYQAASATKLDSFAGAYAPEADKANRIAATFSKTYPQTTRLAKLCESTLVNQMAFLLHVPNATPTLAVLSCPFPTADGTDAIFAGTLGDSMDIICPVTIRMRDVKGSCITVLSSNAHPTRLNMAMSNSDPVSEEGPDPAGEAVAEPPGPDRIGLDITNPDAPPCFVVMPKVFPLAGGYRIPKGPPIDVIATETIRNLNAVNDRDEFHMWFEGMRYGVVHLQNYSLQARNTLFVYDQIAKEQFPEATNLVSHFTLHVNYLTPNDPLYHQVTANVLNAKEKAFVTFGGTLAHRQSEAPITPTKPQVTPNESPTTVNDLIKGLTTAITENKTMTSTEKEHAKDVKENQAFYEILFGRIVQVIDEDGKETSKFKKAKIDQHFLQVLQATKNTKATKLLQAAIENMATEMNYRDTRFASISNIRAELFDQPMTAALRTGTWEYKHTVLHPEGVKTHFGIHHLAPARTWSADYRTRLEGEIRIIQQEQVEEASSRTAAKTTDLYHMGRLNTLSEINEMIANFYTTMHTMIEVDEANPPAIWTEIVEFDRVLRSTEARSWFEAHRSLKEAHFNVAQDIQSTVAGFANIARRQVYKKAIMDGHEISADIYSIAIRQSTTLRTNLQNIVLSMLAGPYKEASFIFKLFQPPEAPNKRKATPEATSDSPNTRTRTNPQAPTESPSTSASTTNRIPRTTGNTNRNPSDLLNNTPPPQGKTILKQMDEDPTAKFMHPGPIFPHPSKPNSFTLMCCRSAYEGKTCTFHSCKFYHFPTNLSTVPADIKTKLTAWVATKDKVEWNTAGAAWATPAGN